MLVVKAEDAYGNKAVKQSGIYYLGLKETNYQISSKKIYNVSPETTVENFVSNISKEILGTNYKVYNSENKEEKERRTL